ncbi:MAG: MerR family transcriptional regulator [Candidatus Acidiferrales bacterium]
MASAAPAPERLPVEEKALFRIGEVSRITNTKTFVLRYWETEFPMLQPVKSPSGHRLYRREDIDTVNEIKRLLYEEGFTIVGARKHLGGGSGDLAHENGTSENGHSHVQAGNSNGLFEFSGAGFHDPHAARAASSLRGSSKSERPLIDRESLIALRDELRAALTLLEDE